MSAKTPGWSVRAVGVEIVVGVALAVGVLIPQGHGVGAQEAPVTAPAYDIKDLGTLSGGNYSVAWDVNNRGQVVGWSDTAASGEARAFLWEDGEVTDLGTLGGIYSAANGINNRGQVVGSSESHAVLWEDGRMTDLGTLPGGEFESHHVAEDINARGQVVGRSPTASGVSHAVLWSK
jgi:probable HAF family extracellular repeat protein